jgi:acyl dehydratase
MTIRLSKPADLLGMVGQEIGTGGWHAITQRQVNIFAGATHDHQWIHVEPERAAKGPYGGPKPAGLECAFGVLVELERSDRPACVIDTVVTYR